MTETALDLITKALKRIGVISGIETPSADLAKDSLDRLNGLIETWTTESLTVYVQSAAIMTLKPNQQVYRIGPATVPPALEPDLIMASSRPPWLLGVSAVMPGTSQYERPLRPISDEEWLEHGQRWLTSSDPSAYHYAASWPQGSLFLSPIYSGGATTTVQVFFPLPLTVPATLTTVLDLPQGYSRALRDWLAIELAPEMGRPVDGGLVQAATDAKAQLQRTNFRPRLLHTPFDICGGGVYDWRIDE